MKVLVTGVAGFIGFYAARALLQRGDEVVGIDDLNAYYDPALKEARLAELSGLPGFSFQRVALQDAAAMDGLAEGHPDIEKILHLGAQAGVRYSLENPRAYAESNLMGHVNVLEMARRLPELQHLTYASSSSVYGGNAKLPYAVGDDVADPKSFYAATKLADEIMARTYAGLYGLAMTGLRFFTVYGPWGRPDMAAWIFTEKILKGEPIELFNHGKMKRDFTYIDDVLAGTLAALDRTPAADETGRRHRLYNLGNHTPVELLRFVEVVEEACGKAADKRFLDLVPGDMLETYADIEGARRDLNFEPRTSIEEGIPRFVEWFRSYKQI